MFTPAVESASDSLIVLEGAESVIDIVMLGMFKAMLDMSIKTLEAIATEILTLLVVKVFSVQNNGDIAKRRGQKKTCEWGNFSSTNTTKKWEYVIRHGWLTSITDLA
jgi:hypothetical protein